MLYFRYRVIKFGSRSEGCAARVYVEIYFRARASALRERTLTPTRTMREYARGGPLVAATVAALGARAAPRDLVPARAAPRDLPPARQRRPRRDRSISADTRADRPASTASETSERDSLSLQSGEEPPPRRSTYTHTRHWNVAKF